MPTTAPKPFVFVLMPFTPAYDDEYKLAIKPACEAAGAYAERVDEQVFQGNVLARIYNQISKADLVVAEMTGRSLNVLYETGYAHALGRPVILLARSAADIPFDARYYSHVVYDSLTALRAELEALAHRLLQSHDPAPPLIPLEVGVDGVILDPHEERRITIGRDDQRFFDVLVRNEGIRFRKSIDVRLGFITPARFDEALAGEEGGNTTNILIGPDRRLHLAEQVFSILPGAWQDLSFWMRVDDKPYVSGESVGSFAVRIMTAAAFVDYPFTVVMA